MDWFFEQEHRLIVYDQDMPDEMPFFRPRKKYFGARMDEQSRACVMDIIDGANVQIYQMKVSDTAYGVVPERLR